MRKEKLQVGGILYTVKWRKSDIIVDHKLCFGSHSSKDCTIEIDARQPSTRQHETLCHEIAHAIDNVYDLANNEHCISLLGAGLSQVLKPNCFNFVERKPNEPKRRNVPKNSRTRSKS